MKQPSPHDWRSRDHNRDDQSWAPYMPDETGRRDKTLHRWNERPSEAEIDVKIALYWLRN